jgi:hypothetical protein
LSFLVQHTPRDLGPSWSKCLSIEYRPVWGGIPEPNIREAIAAITSFLMGRELVNVGHTRFAADGRSISQVALNPRKDNLVFLCQREAALRPVETDTIRSFGGIESLLEQLVPNYLALQGELRLNEALRCYWLSKELPIGLNLPVLSAGLETLASSWFESGRSRPNEYMPKKDFDALLKAELASARSKLETRKYGDRILNGLSRAYDMSINDSLRFFFEDIGLSVNRTEWEAINERHPMAHGSANVFDGSASERMIQATRIYQTLFHRIVLKLLGAQIKNQLDGGKPKLVFQFECGTRGKLMFREQEKLELLKNFRQSLDPDAPWVGFYTVGEIGPVEEHNLRHLYTSVVLALS